MSTESNLQESSDAQLRVDALDYHRSPTRGKIEVVSTKPLSNQRDLSLACSPGVAYACEEIRRIYQPQGDFSGSANLLVMPSLDAANVLFNVLKVVAGKGVTVGPILLGAAKPVHILSPTATAPHRQHDGAGCCQ
jgi:malic enzyme